jgi:hypothetical protein
MRHEYCDIIGDIRGYAAPLEALLLSLGYGCRDGIHRYPSNLAVLVGKLHSNVLTAQFRLYSGLRPTSEYVCL